MSDRVTITIEDGIADVKMNRPDKRNALDPAMFSALAAAGERLKTEPGVRVVVLSGEGKSFCAGLDMASMQAIAGNDDSGDRSTSNAGQMAEGSITHLGQQVCWVWQEVPVPVIAAVHGHALGGGIQIALGADIRIVHPDTKMSVRETYWGLVPDMTGTFQLGKLVAPRHRQGTHVHRRASSPVPRRSNSASSLDSATIPTPMRWSWRSRSPASARVRYAAPRN